MGVMLLKRKLTSFQIIILGFSGVILFGTFLLMLPFSSRSGLATPFSDALFTSTSAVCVTGLIIHDTATYWSAFGQFVILLLIQIGGMGVITIAASFAMISGRKISLMQRSTMQEAISAPKVGGIVRLTGFIVRVTLVMELLCAAVMAPVFCRDFGKKGLWMALFHSVSAFCNAGFDLLGVRTPFSSLTSYAANPVINFTIMFLIVFGGIGFLTWDDIRTNRLHLRKYRMQSKVILCTTAVLLIAPAMYFYFFEFDDLTRKERLLSSLFQAVTPRTAGFNTVDLTDLSEAGQFITIALKGGKKKLDITQICYVEVQDHLLLYHTTEGSFATKGTIRDAESQLDAKSFFRCNRCYLVNLEYVDNYMGSDVSVNGDTIQVSRSRRKPFLDALNEYLNEVGK